MFQIRLGTLLLGVAGIAFGLAFGREDAVQVAFAASSAWIALGLLQQSRDLWAARNQLVSCDQQIIWGWRYAVAWRIFIAIIVGVYWIIDALESSQIIRFATSPLDIRFAGALSQEGLIYLALVIALSSVPWVRGCRPRTARAVTLDALGWTGGLFLGALALSQTTLIEVLVHIAVSSTETAQPYRLAGQLVYDMDVMGDRHRTEVFALLAFAMIGLSLSEFWLASCLVRRRHTPTRRTLMVILLLVALGTSGGYAFWVHTQGLHGISPFLAEAQVLRPWTSWLFAGTLFSMFVAGGVFRLLYQATGESQPIIDWHQGPGAYLNESRITMIALSGSLVTMRLREFRAWEELLSLDTWLWAAESALMNPEYFYLPLAVLWLAMRGVMARRKIADIDRRMTPAAISPPDFLISSVILAGITIGLIEAVAWSTFVGWLS